MRRWIEEGFNARDLAVVDEVFAEAVTVNGAPIGSEGVRRSMGRYLAAFPDLHVTITEVLAEEDKVAIWYTAEGTQRGEFEGFRPTGKRVKWTGVDLLRLAGERIVEAQFLDDSLGLRRQLGG